MNKLTYCEFFAGGGMARAGLGSFWECLLANDHDSKKVSAYKANWGMKNVLECDVSDVDVGGLSKSVDLVWASFPCQDLSQAGAGAGLKGDRSGVFWPFWDKLKLLRTSGNAPKTIVIENVRGTLTSHGGKDFAAICRAFRDLGYAVGALLVDAKLFLPQSRPRLFFIGIRNDLSIPKHLLSEGPSKAWHSKGLIAAHAKLAVKTRNVWLWWAPKVPPTRTKAVGDLLLRDRAVAWHDKQQTSHIIGLMDDLNLAKVEAATKAGTRVVGTIYRRRRPGVGGAVQRAEVRFDELAGCLRTPAGGSSRQTILVVEGRAIRSRLLTAREAARLMGLEETYALPSNVYDAYHLVGDGVAVPVVSFLERELLRPILRPTENVVVLPAGKAQRRKSVTRLKRAA